LEILAIHYQLKKVRLSIIQPGTYSILLEVWSEHDCYDSAYIEQAIVVEKAGAIAFPTAFSPRSSQQLNTIFKPVYRGLRVYHLEIYNRWGEKVFESKDPEVGWDGFIDGKLGSQDVYAWKLSGKYRNGTQIKETGNVTLIR